MLTDWISWRWVLFINVPVGAVLLVSAALFITETDRRPGRFDLAGSLTSTLGMTALVFGFIRAAERDFGETGCLVNGAGFADARDFLSVEPADFAREIDVNLIGLMNCTKVVIGNMSRRRSGTIINVSSVSDRKTAPVAVGYTASKYAVRAVSESLREAEGKNGVRVINVAPGYIKTNIHATMGITFEEYCKALGNPDFMTADELAQIVLYCWKLPPTICVRDIVVAPTRTTF
jgi:NADP-dependent 3-hydroxy acid dehydrogenase YdfG